MKILKEINENEMIAAFLQAEVDSSRFGSKVENALVLCGTTRKIIDQPDLKNDEENETRRQILEIYRGYDDKRLFWNFPKDIRWVRALLTKKELAKVKYINDNSYWIEITKGSRLPEDAAKAIEAGEEIFGEKNDHFWSIAKAIQEGKNHVKLILVGTNENDLVVLEGHARLTGHFLKPEAIPEEIEVIIGLSKNMNQWGLY